MAASPAALLHTSSLTYFTMALFLLFGVASEAGRSRAPDMEIFKRTSHALFIDTQTRHWENATNQWDNIRNLQNNITLNKVPNKISLREYKTENNKNVNRNYSTTYSISNTNRNNKNYKNNSDDDNDPKNILKLPLVIGNKLIVINAFKDLHPISNIDTGPNLNNKNHTLTNTELVNTWAKMRRSAAQSSDSLLTRLSQTGDGNRRRDTVINVRRLEGQSDIAASLRQQFNHFKDYLATNPPKIESPKKGIEEIYVEKPKTIRKAGEEIGMVESGVLPASAHPIWFLPQPRRTMIGATSGRAGISQGSRRGHTGGSLTGRLHLGTNRTPAPISRTPVHYAIPLQSTPGLSPELVHLLQARLGSSSSRRRVHYDPSIIVDFLTLVSLSQRHNSHSGDVGDVGRSRTEVREATILGNTDLASSLLSISTRATENQDNTHHYHGEFGPFSNGNDPEAGIDPSNIAFPPKLRQTLYTYLLPRLPALGALLDTVPGVPGLDYPIIGSVPYTNFYCQDMPWPGFYADTEARCQTWHFCDLEGRQSSFLCPNGTVFNQAFLICDWWYNFDCQTAPFLYAINERVFDLPEIDETAPHRTLTPEILDSLFL